MTNTARRSAPVAILLSLGLLAACGGDGDDPSAGRSGGDGGDSVAQAADGGDDDEAWPTPEWTSVDAEEVGLDQAALEAMAAEAEAGNSQCLVVTRDGQLAGEWYWRGFGPEEEREVFSVTKSITATLVGIAQEQGHLDIDQPASDFVEEWKGTPSEPVTIRQLLSMSSGRRWVFEDDFGTLVRAEDQTGYAIGLDQEHEPGTRWFYNNSGTQVLDAVLSRATGTPTHEYAEQVLFEPTGMDAEMTQDGAGNTLTYMGAQSSCRDLARFGLLYLRDGEWDGEQVVPASWVEEATSVSQDLNPAYGYLWWLNEPGLVGIATGDDPEGAQLVPDMPEDAFAALGLGGQLVTVFPSSDVVVVRMGDAAEEGGTDFDTAEIGAGVRAALGDDAPPLG